MSVKIKIIRSKAARVPVQVQRPAWQEFIKY
jgi:hypothetical protein